MTLNPSAMLVVTNNTAPSTASYGTNWAAPRQRPHGEYIRRFKSRLGKAEGITPPPKTSLSP